MPVATDPRIAIEQAKQHAENGKARFLKTFSYVPDDKLGYAPSQTARTPLRVAAHVGLANFNLAKIIRGEPLPDVSAEELFAKVAEAEKGITTREQALQTIEASHQDVLSALDSLSPDMIEREVHTPGLDAPMTFYMNLPGLHMFGHAAQIDYQQTIWGDMDPHFN